MTTSSVSRVMRVDASVAWNVLVDTSRWADWGPSVTAVDTPDVRLRAHTTGRVRTALGVWLPFKVTAFEDGRSWAWTVAGVPATTHSVETAPGGCRVTFGVPVLAAPYALVCRTALRRIERLAKTTATP